VDPPQGEASPALKRVFKIRFFTDYDKDLIIHWGVGRRHHSEWSVPEEQIWPSNTKAFPSGGAVQTLFARDDKEPGYKSVLIEIEADNLKIKGMNYVFFNPTNVFLLEITIFRINGSIIMV